MYEAYSCQHASSKRVHLGSMLSCFAYTIFKYRFATFFRGEQGLLPYLEVKTVSTVMFLEFQSTTQGLLVIPSPYFKGRLSAKPLKKENKVSRLASF